MGLRINTNVASLNARRNLGKTRFELSRTLEKLSSGERINRAGDDAAGLAISENLKAQIRGLGQAERNAEDGVSLVQIAEGALAEISNILIRLRELSVQAASDTIGRTERKFLNVEFEQLTSEIDRIANSTEFNRVPLLNGTGAVFDIQIGTRNDPISDRLTFDASSADVNVAALGLNLASVADKIIAAPFALLGSIGVVAQIPNVHKLLKKNDVDVELLTAGKYKRTLSIFGENTEEGRQKFIEEIEDVHLLFQEFVTNNRPDLDIEKVATGEAWYGKRALELNLVDQLLTSDEYIVDLCSERSVYQVEWEINKSPVDKFLGKVNGTLDRVHDLLSGVIK